jgi:hypothetical protein
MNGRSPRDWQDIQVGEREVLMEGPQGGRDESGQGVYYLPGE